MSGKLSSSHDVEDIKHNLCLVVMVIDVGSNMIQANKQHLDSKQMKQVNPSVGLTSW